MARFIVTTVDKVFTEYEVEAPNEEAIDPDDLDTAHQTRQWERGAEITDIYRTTYEV